jgi:methylmalonyl-CoA/ethylmalonyl-CoA epimerase
MPSQTLHHVGFVVSSIAQSGERFARPIAAAWDGRIFEDPHQKVRVAFFYPEVNGPSIELVEPASDDSPVTKFLQRGGGLHHVCYEVDSLEEQLQASRRDGAALVKPPLPAVAFEGRRIAWVITPLKLLIEYLER